TLLLCLFAMGTGISAQTYKMTGQLLSWIDSTSIPVSGVIIFMFDQRTVANVDSTVTDSLGHFSLNIPDVPSPSFILYGTFNGAYFSMLYVDYATKFRKCPTYLDGRVVTATTEISKSAVGK